MSYNKRRNKHERDYKPFVRLEIDMLLNCQEWKELSSSAKLLYLYIKAKYNGVNNGAIKLSYLELKSIIGISSPKTISKAQKELIEEGWIKKTERGGILRHANLFKLTWKFDSLK